MVKILHIQRAGPIAGAERHLLQLLSGLQRRGYSVTFLALTKPHEAPSALTQALIAQGIPVIDQRIYTEFEPQILPRICRIIRRGGYDIVHTHLLYADLYGALAARWAGKVKIVCTRHNDNPYRRYWPMRPLIAWNTCWMDHVIVISEHLKAFNMKYQRVPAHKITVIPYGYTPSPLVERPCWPWEPEALVIGMVGRLVPQKSHATALRAFPLIHRQVPQARLVILGDGPLRPSLMALADRLRITPYVQFLGYQPDAAQWMAGFDIFLHTSLHEGFGLVLLEAMAARRPIVATRVGAIPEIVVHGQTGLLVPPGDPQALAQAVSQLLLDGSLRRQLGEAGYQRLLREFSVEKMLDRTVGVYEFLLSKA
ncbi:MAG: glycosyltransferase family 4 protein [Gloeomargarita sp. GMQP_bins_120]